MPKINFVIYEIRKVKITHTLAKTYMSLAKLFVNIKAKRENIILINFVHKKVSFPQIFKIFVQNCFKSEKFKYFDHFLVSKLCLIKIQTFHI